MRGSLWRMMRWTAAGFAPDCMSKLAVLCRLSRARDNRHMGYPFNRSLM
jgi:hypothetical protein